MSDLEIVLQEWPRLASGFGNTLLLFAISAVGAFLLGALMVGPLRSRSRIVRLVLRSFVDGMRMLPFLIFVYLLYYGLPTFGVKLDAWTAGLLGLTIYHCAYVAEILRGAWDQLPVGQTESAQAHGYHGLKLLRPHHQRAEQERAHRDWRADLAIPCSCSRYPRWARSCSAR